MKAETIDTNKNEIIVKPDRFALIIGGMKCGTTSLFDILSQHPQIIQSRVKEPDYFVQDRTEDEKVSYLSLWNWNTKERAVAMEASVAYTKAPIIKDVPKRISEAKLGEYKFIYMMRDPLKRIESQLRHGLFAGWGKSLDAGIGDDLIAFSRYAMQLDNYLEYFSREDVLLVTLEGFKANPETTLSRICKFLEVDSDYHFSNVNKPRNSGDFFNAPPFIAKITQSKYGKSIANRILTVDMKKRLRNIISNLGNINKKKGINESSIGRWKLNSEERKIILDELKEDLDRLKSDFGIEVDELWDLSSIKTS